VSVGRDRETRMSDGDVAMTNVANPAEEARNKALDSYKKKLLEHRQIESKVRGLRMGLRDLNKDFDKTEDDLKALQSVGQIIGELLRQLDEER
jgi:26S proteasome regulatory subunit T4